MNALVYSKLQLTRLTRNSDSYLLVMKQVLASEEINVTFSGIEKPKHQYINYQNIKTFVFRCLLVLIRFLPHSYKTTHLWKFCISHSSNE